MAWDKAKPAEGIKAKFLNDLIRENNDALEDALERDHKFPGTMGSDAGEHLQITFNAPLGADPAGAANKGVLYTKDVTALAELFFVREDDVVCRVEMFPTGTVMLFGQNAAPTGWTRKADWTDNSMLVYAATGDIAAGGSVSAESRHTHASLSHTHGPGTLKFVTAFFDNLVLKLINSAGNYIPVVDSLLYVERGSARSAITVSMSDTWFYTGTGSGNTGAGGTGATGLNDQPYFQEVIAATKD